MARTAELVLRLVDQVTGPARAIAGALGALNTTMGTLKAVNAISGRVAQGGREMRRSASDLSALSLPMFLIGRGAAQTTYEFEKAGNAAQAYGDITAEQREELERYAAVLNEDSPFTLGQIMDAANELFRAGLTYEQAMGALQGSLELGAAGDLDVGVATDFATNLLTSLRLPMETAEQVIASLDAINDALAYSAANSNADVLQMAEAFKYAGGIATAVGIPMDELAVMFMTMAKNGIKGSEAGVALRSGIVRMLRPTLFAQRQLEALNIEMGEFVTLGESIDFSNIQDAVSSLTGNDLSAIRPEIETLLSDDTLKRSPQKLVAKVMELIAREVEASGADMEVVGDAVVQAIMTGAERVDMLGFLKELNEKGAGAVDLSYIWDVRQGSRLISLLSEDLDALLATFDENVDGAAASMAATRLLGIVGIVNEFDAAVTNLYISIANSGVLESVSQLIKGFTDWFRQLAELNPKILEFGTYAAGAVAALAPLGFILSGLASSLAFLTSPVTLVAAALGAIVALNWDSFVAGIEGFKANLDPHTIETISGWAEAIAGLAASIFGSKELGSFISNELARFADDIDQLVLDIEAIIAAFQDLPAAVQRVSGDLLNAFMTGPLMTKLSELADFISSAFANIDLFAVGAQIMQSLINGVLSAIPGLKEAIGLAQGLFPQMAGTGNGRTDPGSYVNHPDGALNVPDVPARASGGPLWDGWFLAGEKGPELGYTSGKGHMFNAAETKRMLTGGRAHRMPGGDSGDAAGNSTMHVVQNIKIELHNVGVDLDTAARQISQKLGEQLERSRGLSMEGRMAYG